MSSGEGNRTDSADQADFADAEVPELFTMLLGENAGAAWATAGERMLRWAAALVDWWRERTETCHQTVTRNDKLAWQGVVESGEKSALGGGLEGCAGIRGIFAQSVVEASHIDESTDQLEQVP